MKVEFIYENETILTKLNRFYAFSCEPTLIDREKREFQSIFTELEKQMEQLNTQTNKIKKIIEKYENENKDILNGYPNDFIFENCDDYSTQAEYRTNNYIIEDLKSLLPKEDE